MAAGCFHSWAKSLVSQPNRIEDGKRHHVSDESRHGSDVNQTQSRCSWLGTRIEPPVSVPKPMSAKVRRNSQPPKTDERPAWETSVVSPGFEVCFPLVNILTVETVSNSSVDGFTAKKLPPASSPKQRPTKSRFVGI